ncbi:MAG: pyruvate formate lyase family protein [Promethearchaeota archaeon]
MIVQNYKVDPLNGTPSERVGKIRDEMLSHPFEYDLERARCYTRIYKQLENENAPPGMKKAKALEEYLRCIQIRIDDNEILVGKKSSKVRADPMEIEQGRKVGVFGFLLDDTIDPKLKAFFRSIYSLFDRYQPLTEEELTEMKNEIIPFWKGKTLDDKKNELFREAGLIEEKDDKLPEIPMFLVGGTNSISFAGMQGHTIPGYPRVLEMGFKGIEKMAAEQLSKLKESDENYEHRKDFLESAQITARAVYDYSNRYAELASEMAKTASEERRVELLDMAERARRVPAYPPRSFMEALQAIWMTNVVMEMSYGEGNIFSQGRVDQYINPYYSADIAEGRITHGEAVEAIEEYLVKLSTVVIAGQNNVTIGGVDKNGMDAANEVSYLFLEAISNVKSLLNTLSIRISSKTPHDFVKRAVEAFRHTAGMAFHNDEILIPQLQKTGYSLQDARNYSIVGCVEPHGTGNDFSYTAGNGIWLSVVLNAALNEGRVLAAGNKTIGLKTPDPSTFTSFEDVKQAFVDQLKNAIDLAVKKAELKDKAFAEYFPSPLLSSTIEGCLESGLDVTRNGALYNNNPMGTQGLGTVTNSLAAIRWAVFDEKLVTMGELMKHVRNNFKGAKELREVLKNKAPKYGNGDERTDDLAKWVAHTICDITRKYKARGGDGIYHPCMISSGTHTMEGKMLGATPDGRISGEPVSNGISPVNGTEKNGLTMTLRSAALATKDALLTNGVTFNIRISPSLISTDEGLDQMASIVESYFELGGRNLQINPVGTETLKDAQAHPEKYPDLSVKVSGYSARFIDLRKSLQDDIIARTEFNKL